MNEPLFKGYAPLPKRQVTITISGPANSGRIALASVIRSVLREQGVTVFDRIDAAEGGPVDDAHALGMLPELGEKVNVTINLELVGDHGLILSNA